MKISLSKDSSYNRIERVSDGCIVVNEQRYEGSLIVAPNEPVMPWKISSISELDETDFQHVLGFQPEIVLLGTGVNHLLAPGRIQALFLQRHIGFESMTTIAACRTYNLLAEDQRNVVACLIQ